LNRFLLSLIGAAIGLATASGIVTAQTSTDYIVGGTPAEEGKWPWQVRILENADDRLGFCGGSLIAPDWVLTAAHCVFDANGSVEKQLVVGYGSINREKLKMIDTIKIIPHPDYQATDKADFALLKLAAPVPDAHFISIADAATEARLAQPGAVATVTGWGALWDFKTFEKSLNKSGSQPVSTLKLLKQKEDAIKWPVLMHQVDIKLISSDDCKAAYEELGIDVSTDAEICAGEPSGVKDSCFGDSGGPLVVAADTRLGYVQIGVVSWGLQCGNPAFPTIYSRVAGYTDWIANTMKQ
jgi:secreted trypsin-like serine protease